MGGLAGGVLGGLGGWAGGIASANGFGTQFLVGTIAAGGAYSAATGNLDSFAGGLIGGLAGWGIGNGIVTGYKQQFANYRAGYGFRSNADAQAAGFNTKEWIGYNERQYQTLQSQKGDILNTYRNDSNVDFVRNPTFDQYKQALQGGYRDVLLHTHGGPPGLEFANGIHSLRELSGISINAHTVGISSCYPSVQVGDWHSLNVSQVNYLDLSAIGHFAGDPQASDRLLGIGKVYNAYKNN